jgi:putative aldouronate transport system permease protein
MALPGVVWLVLFRYVPILGSVIAFQDYKIFLGLANSDWVGLQNFRSLFANDNFVRILRNTLVLGFYTVVLIFPIPIVVALMLNELRSVALKRSVQTLLYLPHFFSWVIIAGFAFELLSLQGPLNEARRLMGLDSVLYMQQSRAFRPIVTLATVYRETGWGTIVYLAAISGIDPQLYEAAAIDGAGRLQRMRHITVPSILPTAVVLLLLSIGNFMNLGFDRVWVFLTPMTYETGDIFDTFVFRVGISQGEYSVTTAIGLFQSVVGLLLIVLANRASHRLSEGLW